MSILDGRCNALFIGFINADRGKTVWKSGGREQVVKGEFSGATMEPTAFPAANGRFVSGQSDHPGPAFN